MKIKKFHVLPGEVESSKVLTQQGQEITDLGNRKKIFGHTVDGSEIQ